MEIQNSYIQERIGASSLCDPDSDQEDSPFWYNIQQHPDMKSDIRSDKFLRISPYLKTYDDLESMFAIKNPDLVRISQMNDITKFVEKVPPTSSVRAGLKLLRKMVYEPVIKGGKPPIKDVSKIALITHENWPNNKEPDIGEIIKEVKKTTKGGNNFYRTNGRTKIEQLISKHFPELPINPNPSRMWCTNKQLDTYLKTFDKYMEYIPAGLLIEMERFLQRVLISTGDRLPICQILNTAITPPGQHWFSIIYDPRTHQLQWTDSANEFLDSFYYKMVSDFCKMNNIMLILPFVISQASESECGIYSAKKIEQYVLGDTDFMLFGPILDIELHNSRMRMNQHNADI